VSTVDPANTTVQDLCTEAVRESGAFGQGQTPSGEDIAAAWARLQWMLQEWERKRWLIYYLVDLAKTSTGATSYTIGPGGDFDTGVDTVRPVKIESAFLRQLTTSGQNEIDYPLEILQSREDYNRIALKTLQSFPGTIFLETAWPLGNIYAWPVPQAALYAIHVTIVAQLPTVFATLATKLALPYEYYQGILYQLAMRMRSYYQISTYPGDQLPILAKNALATLRGANTQIARLVLPNFNRDKQFNIFSDRFY
jgi:hypothetical protein